MGTVMASQPGPGKPPKSLTRGRCEITGRRRPLYTHGLCPLFPSLCVCKSVCAFVSACVFVNNAAEEYSFEQGAQNVCCFILNVFLLIPLSRFALLRL